MIYIYPGGSLRGSDYYWLHSLKRNDKAGVPKNFKFWKWQWVRPEHAWLSKRGWVCYKPEWLPAGTQKIEIAEWPLPDYIEWEEAPCIIDGCPC